MENMFSNKLTNTLYQGQHSYNFHWSLCSEQDFRKLRTSKISTSWNTPSLEQFQLSGHDGGNFGQFRKNFSTPHFYEKFSNWYFAK